MNEFFKSLARKGWRPHLGQVAYLESKARFRVLACGRRWGKTDAAAAEIAQRMTRQESSRQLAIAPTLAQSRIVFERILWMLTACGVTFAHAYTPHPVVRIFDNDAKSGRVIHVLDARSGHESNHLRGEGADHILLDEAAYMPETLITEVTMPMLAANNGRMTLISTPRGRNFFYRYFRMGERRRDDFWSRRSPSYENPRVNREFLELQRKLLTERAFRTEYEAEFLDNGSTVFASEALDAALSVPSVSDGPIVLGVDWARYRDYTACVLVRGYRERAEVLAVRRWSGLRWFETLRRVVDIAKEFGVNEVVSDATGVGDPVTEQLRYLLPNSNIHGHVFTRRSKSELIDHLIWMFERESLRLPSEPFLLRELEHFEAEADTESDVKYSAPSGQHDDCVCALALACSVLPCRGSGLILSRERSR